MVEDKAALRKDIEEIQRQIDLLRSRLDSLVSVEEEGRYRTFIKGLDERIGGGLPRSHVVLLSGPSGSMKSSLALNILSKNIEQGTSGIYLTLDERKESLLRTAANLGLKIEEGSIVDIGEMRRVEEIAPDATDWFGIITKYLRKMEGKKRVSLVVLDSLDSVLSLTDYSSPRDAISRFFHSLRDLDLTSIIIDEAESETGYPNHEDRIADGNIFVTFDVYPRLGVKLIIRCVKMRHTKHSMDYYNLNFENGDFFLTELSAQ
ncbi:MAG: RAD55 family ATPase [Thermoplasmata archaeon]